MSASILERNKLKLPEKHLKEQVKWEILVIPPELSNFDCISLVCPSEGSQMNLLIADDHSTRKTLNLYKSIAERLATRILTTPPGNFTHWFPLKRQRAKRYNVEKESIETLLQEEEFANVRQIIINDIMENWNIERFVSFFVGHVDSIVCERQFNGINRVKNQKRNSFGKQRDDQDRSVKQEFRRSKKCLYQ